MVTKNKILRYVPLSPRVLVVAVKGEVNDWAAYIDAVPGISHEREFRDVAENGSKLSKEIAVVLFPDIAALYVWRE